MDAIVLPNCPNIFEFYSDHTFSAVRDAPWDKDQHFEEKRQLFNKVYGAKSDYRPFCSGVVLATKKFLEDTKDMWRQYINSFDSSSNAATAKGITAYNSGQLIVQGSSGVTSGNQTTQNILLV